MSPKRNSVRWHLDKWRVSNAFAIIVVGGALFIDGIVVSLIVPIIPLFLTDGENKSSSITHKTWNYEVSVLFEKDIENDDAVMSKGLSYGFILAMKSIAQLVTNLFVGPVADRIGYSWPFFAGFIFVFFSTASLAYATSITVLIIARIVQGVGSSFLTVVGLALLASRYTDDQKRGQAMTYVLGGLNFGLLIGAPFAGYIYQYTGKPGPFLIVCSLTVVIAGLRLLMVDQIKSNVKDKEISSPLTLICDPYIALAAAALFVANLFGSFSQLALPLWMIDTMNSNSQELGFVFLPCDIVYLSGIKVYPVIVRYIDRWAAAIIAFILMIIVLLILPLQTSLMGLILPMALAGFSVGLSQTSLLPVFAHLIDTRHTSEYGNVYAIGDFAQCLCQGTVPIIGGYLMMKSVSFRWLTTGIAIIHLVFSPTLFFLRNPPSTNRINESEPLMRTLPEACCTL